MVDAIGWYTAMFDYFQHMVIHQKVRMIVIVVKTFSGEESNPRPIDKPFGKCRVSKISCVLWCVHQLIW